MSFRNENYLRNLPEWGQRLYEALADLDRQHQTLAQQVNGNSTGQPKAPPNISSLNVLANNGHFDVAITDQSPVYRGINYFLEHADNPNFTNPTIVDLGQTRNHNLFLGDVTRYFRAYSSYQNSPPSQPAYHGGTQPSPVVGGGTVGGPPFQASQGSGTGNPGVGLQGPGIIPYRSTNGKPPVR